MLLDDLLFLLFGDVLGVLRERFVFRRFVETDGALFLGVDRRLLDFGCSLGFDPGSSSVLSLMDTLKMVDTVNRYI
ncbi:MAG: hypothetical protein ACI80F_002126 [Natronomonas sp.]|jgi:hypothetical protein|uniref:hypothetical protein n=1 Tax=Natronomonas sp. TaxID=2184060 RepID=UPI00398A18BD